MATAIGARSVGGRGGSLPGAAFGARARPRCPAAHRRRLDGRPITRLRSPSARICPTPGAAGMRASAASTPSCSVTVVRGNVLNRGSGGGRDGRRLLIVDRDQAQDLVLAGARRHRHLDDVAFFVIEEALPDGRGGGDLAVRGIRLLG